MTCRVMRRVLHPKTPCKTCFPGPYRWWVVCDRVYLTSATATDLRGCPPARTRGNINFSTQYNTERSTEDWTTPVVMYDRVYLTSATSNDLVSCLPAWTQGNINFSTQYNTDDWIANFEIWPQHKPSAMVGHSGLSFR